MWSGLITAEISEVASSTVRPNAERSINATRVPAPGTCLRRFVDILLRGQSINERSAFASIGGHGFEAKLTL